MMLPNIGGRCSILARRRNDGNHPSYQDVITYQELEIIYNLLEVLGYKLNNYGSYIFIMIHNDPDVPETCLWLLNYVYSKQSVIKIDGPIKEGMPELWSLLNEWR